jgi:chloride channel protein, CIC family
MSTTITRSQQLLLRESQLFLALAVIIGILAGLAAVLFTVAIERVTRLLFGLDPSAARLFAVPALVSIGTGVLLAKVFPEVRGSGVPQTETAYRLRGGAIPGRVPIGKFLTGVLCIGSGHSMGREGPSVQIGAGLAAAVGRWIGLSPERTKDLVPVGAAGALAAAFNTPVAAVLFSLEEIIGDMNASLIGSTVVASVSSVIVERAILGNEPLFRVPTYHLEHPAELAAYGVLGVIGGLVSLAFCKGLLGLRRMFLSLPAGTRIVQPALGGAIIGALLIIAPQVMGVGYDWVDQALNGGLVFKTLLLLCTLKLVATIVSYASGNAGGIFAPSLFIGAMAGGALGTIVHRLAPFPTAEPGAYALVGMGTLFAGIIRAPMTSVFMIFEITQDYQILVPLMVANLLSFVISRRFQPTPVYHALLQQDGVHLPAVSAKPPQRTWSASDLMSPAGTLVPVNCTIQSLWEKGAENGRPVYLVGDRGRLVGIVTGASLAKAVENGRTADPVGSIVEPTTVHVHPDHPLEVVLERFAQSPGILPVIDRADSGHVEGIVTMEEVLRFVQGRTGRPIQ